MSQPAHLHADTHQIMSFTTTPVSVNAIFQGDPASSAEKNFWQVAMVQPCLPWNLHLFFVSPSLKLRLQASQHRSLPVRWQDIIPPRGILGRKLKESDWVHQESLGMWPKLYQQAELYSIGMAHDLSLFYLEQRNLDGEFHQNANRISSVYYIKQAPQAPYWFPLYLTPPSRN